MLSFCFLTLRLHHKDMNCNNEVTHAIEKIEEFGGISILALSDEERYDFKNKIENSRLLFQKIRDMMVLTPIVPPIIKLYLQLIGQSSEWISTILGSSMLGAFSTVGYLFLKAKDEEMIAELKLLHAIEIHQDFQRKDEEPEVTVARILEYYDEIEKLENNEDCGEYFIEQLGLKETSNDGSLPNIWVIDETGKYIRCDVNDISFELGQNDEKPIMARLKGIDMLKTPTELIIDWQYLKNNKHIIKQ